MAADQEATPKPDRDSSSWHYFICSGNPSLIDAFSQLFTAAESPGFAEFRRCYASNDNLEARRPRATEAGLAFSGSRFMGEQSTPAEDLDSVLSSMAHQGTAGVHVVIASVDDARRGLVEETYKELLTQAVQQGILPFPMFVTRSEDAARFVEESLTAVG